MWGTLWLSIPNVTESHSLEPPQVPKGGFVQLFSLTLRLPPSAPIKAGGHDPLAAFLVSLRRPTLSLPLEGIMDWFETKPSHSQTERFLFTFGNNLKPLEKIMCQLCINSFTTRYKGSHNSGGLCLIEFICFHFVNRAQGESVMVDS